MEFVDKRILVLGLGRSGLAAAKWLATRGAKVTVSDVKEAQAIDHMAVREARNLGIPLETGGHRERSFLNAQLIIVSPGVPLDILPLAKARKAGVPVLGELELASRLVDLPILAVTGTNGKSTVTAFLAALLERAGRRVFLGGNIGTPLMEYLLGRDRADVAVVEVSSFQLDSTEHFSPHLAMLLNITPDHLDRYRDYEDYIFSKLRIFQNQGPGQVAILNDDDGRLCRVNPAGGASVLRYGMKEKEGRHAFFTGNGIRAFVPGGPVGQVHDFGITGFRLHGLHNLSNLLGIVLAGLAMEVDPEIIRQAIDGFEGLPHRLQHVKRIAGVDFYDDSKATNVDAAARSLSSFDRPVILIAGGRDKGGDYGPLVTAARGRVKKAIFLGESKELLGESFHGVIPFQTARDMAEAVSAAFATARADDAVLLAPACSSFDMFEDYVHRGMAFQAAVRGLEDGRQ